MYREELIKYVRTHAQPDGLDIEVARQIILDHLHIVSQSTFEPIGSSQLLSVVTNQKQLFDKPTPVENGYEPLLKDQLGNVRAELAAREALLSLHANGVLIAYGAFIVESDGRSPLQKYVTINNNNHPYYSQPENIGTIYLPSVHSSYRLAALFRDGQTFRLASGDIYLASLNQAQLPSRAKRCLRECTDAFKYGLYLSATMSVGAASESLWMKLASLLVDKKPSATNSLSKQLRLFSPSISTVIDEAWQALVSQFVPELEQVFSNKSERKVFKDHADRLCERRNYAMHSEDADEDEPYFTRNETGMLLLGSISYFNKLTELIATLEALS